MFKACVSARGLLCLSAGRSQGRAGLARRGSDGRAQSPMPSGNAVLSPTGITAALAGGSVRIAYVL